jgi:hypothetical protein
MAGFAVCPQSTMVGLNLADITSNILANHRFNYMSLYISVNTPSANLDKSPIDEAIIFYATSIAMEKRIGSFPAGPKLDITFMLSTQDDAPSFNGMRMGAYDDQDQTLYFETAVPIHISQSSHAQQYVQAVLQDALDNAQDYFSEIGVEFNFDQWRQTIEKLIQPEPAQTTH